MRGNLTNNEKFANAVCGMDNETFTTSNDITMEEKAAKEKAIKLETESAEWAAKFDAYAQDLQNTASDLSKHPNLQIKPLANYVLVQPFKVNPFQKITRSAGGIITDLGGMAPTYKSNDSGQWEEEEQFIFQGTVVEVGPEVKWLKPNDIVMWTKPSEVPIPFFRLGLVQVNESRVLCVINDNLNERF